MTTAHSADTTPEFDLIVTSLNRIRRRLWLTRLTERLALALACGAVVAVFLVGARLLRDRFPSSSIIIAALPILLAAWLWIRTPRIDNAVLNAWLIRAAAVLAALLSLAAIAALSLSFWHVLPLWSISAACLAVFALAAAASVRIVDTRTAAIFVDQQVGLKERVSTALEFLGTPPTSPLEASFRRPLIDSALAACVTVRTTSVGYARLDQRVYALALTTLLAAAGISLLSPLPALAKGNPQQFVVVDKVGRLLAEEIKRIEEKKSNPDGDSNNKKLEPLKIALQDIRRENMNAIDASARLAQARGDLQKEADSLAAADKVQEALAAAKNLEQLNQATGELKQADMKAAAGDTGAAQAKSEAQHNMDSAAKALGDKLKNGQMSPAEQKGLASDLKAAAEKAKGDPQLQKSLEQAAKAAEKGDGDALSKNLNEAGARTAQQSTEQKLSGQALRDAMAAADSASSGLGGDEQSAKNGQKGGDQGDSGGPSGGQSGDSGDSQANAGNQNPGQDGDNNQGNQGDQGGQDGQGGGKKPGAGSQDGQGGQGNSGSQVSNGNDSKTGGGGSTNFKGASGPGDQYQGRDVHGEGTFVKLYDEKLVGTKGERIKVSGQINPLNPDAGKMDVMGLGDKNDKTIVEYESARGSARAKAMDDLSKDQIPPQYRELIRDYYAK